MHLFLTLVNQILLSIGFLALAFASANLSRTSCDVKRAASQRFNAWAFTIVGIVHTLTQSRTLSNEGYGGIAIAVALLAATLVALNVRLLLVTRKTSLR